MFHMVIRLLKFLNIFTGCLGGNCFLGFFALLLPIPQIYVITLEKSSRVCDQPLLNLAVASVVLTFFTIVFTLLFLILVPVPRAVKIFFHVFGVTSFIVGLITFIYTMEAQEDCSVSTPELLLLSQISSGLSIAATVFLAIMFPFWVINKAKPKVVLDPYSRTGVCYEPVKCCTCLWHI